MIQGPCCSIDSDSILSDMRKGVQKTIAFSNDANSLSALQDRIDNATSASLFEDFVPLDSLTRQAPTLLFPCAYEGGQRLCGRAESFAMAKPINRNNRRVLRLAIFMYSRSGNFSARLVVHIAAPLTALICVILACAPEARAQFSFDDALLSEVAANWTDNSDWLGFQSRPATQEPAEGQTQTWNLHFQNTDIMQGYPAFGAKYSGTDSLPTGGQIRETVSADVYAGFRLWSGAEAHVDELMWQGFGLHDTFGVDDFPNGEAFKVGTVYPRLNIARVFIRQTIGLGGEEQERVPDDQLTLASTRDISRVTITVGRFSAKDVFDNNSYANDPRTQFMNWALMANAAWDYPADALGYTTGLAIELNQPKWALRYGFFQMPLVKNGWTAEDAAFIWPGYNGAGDGEFFSSWGMVTELERRYSINAHPGTIRFLSYLNEAHMGSYHAALSIPDADISQTRRYRYKYGFGLNWEQEIIKNIGVFSRLGWNDGDNEAWTFTDANYSASLGMSVKGEAWRRPDDTVGVAGVMSGISRVNEKFLEAGGTDILDGDGALNYGLEKILETYYDCTVWKNIHAAVDYQFVDDPAFNRDRGPVSILALRVHMEL